MSFERGTLNNHIVDIKKSGFSKRMGRSDDRFILFDKLLFDNVQIIFVRKMFLEKIKKQNVSLGLDHSFSPLDLDTISFLLGIFGTVLVVMENGGRFKETGVWKFPTGVVNEGEDICTAAVREVKEETGIDAEFVEVLAFRESHKSFFSKSDLFFVCMLKPRSFDIQKQDQEVEAAQWMPFEEYAAQPFIREHELFNYVAKICLAKSDKGYAGFSPVSAATSSGKTSCLYCNNPDIHLLTSGHQ
ncbi:nudix hydrolase 2-like [Corylus avellana]|uniref:nudix hydrolase 2-like n=1 Tax=Corylus avellana TaxID=13451 RepID=UPI00286AABD6|nr:nudix hydrolase 2-like [Corylus avellana]